MDRLSELTSVSLDGRPLKPYVDAAPLTLSELARALGCHVSFPAKVIAGERTISYEMAQAACQVLGVSFAEVFGPQLAAIGLQPIGEAARG